MMGGFMRWLFLIMFPSIVYGVSNGKNYDFEYIEGVNPKAIIQIRLKDGGFCSGFFITPNKIITAKHCLNHGIRRIDGIKIKRICRMKRDIAHIHVYGRHAHLRRSKVEGLVGEYVFLIGYSDRRLQYGFTYITEAMWGQYLSVVPVESVYGSLEPGDSGGPLVTMSGSVIGVASKGLINGGLLYSSFEAIP